MVVASTVTSSSELDEFELAARTLLGLPRQGRCVGGWLPKPGSGWQTAYASKSAADARHPTKSEYKLVIDRILLAALADDTARARCTTRQLGVLDEAQRTAKTLDDTWIPDIGQAPGSVTGGVSP